MANKIIAVLIVSTIAIGISTLNVAFLYYRKEAEVDAILTKHEENLKQNNIKFLDSAGRLCIAYQAWAKTVDTPVKKMEEFCNSLAEGNK